MQRSQNWFASMSVCRPSISDNFNSDMEGRVACCEEATCSDTRHTFFLCVDGQFVRVAKTTCFPQRNGDMLYAQVECTNSHLLGLRLYRLLLRDGSMFSLWVLGRHLEFPSVQPAVVRHFALDVDPFWALCPRETRVVDSRCWCVDWKRLRQCGCVAKRASTCL